MTQGPKRSLVRMPVRQVAALCWRRSPRLEVLLVTSLRTRRWILPKGWPELGLTLGESAAHEALEEAGVEGIVSKTPVGRYHYGKEKRDGTVLPCEVVIFALEVKMQRRNWHEKSQRERLWLTPEQAASRVSEPGIRAILTHFAKRQAAA